MRVMLVAMLVALMLATALAPGATAGGDLTVTQTNAPTPGQDQLEPDNTITRINLTADGSGAWEITIRTLLSTEEDVEEFERFQASFRENTSVYLDPFEERMIGVVDQANEAHDREMRAVSFTASTTIQEVPRRWGIVRFQFTWEGFAMPDGDRIVVGDVFDRGFYIGEEDVLQIAAPAGYDIADVDPRPDEVSNAVVEWHGRADFADGRPRVVAAPSSEPPIGSDDSQFDGIVERYLTLLVGGVLIGVVIVALYAIRRGRLSKHGVLGKANGGRAAGTAPDARTAAGIEPEAASTAETGSAPLMADEDRVRQILRDNGGRMKQSTIVEELGWSKSKTSRVLTRMAEDGTVEKLRLGRENVIGLIENE